MDNDFNIRLANPEDFESIKSLYADFSGDNMATVATLDKSIVSNHIKVLIDKHSVVVGFNGNKMNGFVAGMFAPSIFSADIFFQVLFFYVSEPHRMFSGKLLNSLTVVLSNTMATKVTVSSPAFNHHEKYDRFYEMNGFKLLEKHYYKEVKHGI